MACARRPRMRVQVPSQELPPRAVVGTRALILGWSPAPPQSYAEPLRSMARPVLLFVRAELARGARPAAPATATAGGPATRKQPRHRRPDRRRRRIAQPGA